MNIIKDLLFPKKKITSSKAGNTSVAKPERLADEMKGQPGRESQTVEPGQKIDTGPSYQVPKPKRKIPLIVIAIPIVLILLVLVAGVVYRMVGSGSEECGTPGEIVWWGMTDERVIKPIIEEYRSQNEGVDIKYVQQSPTDYRVRLSNSFANCSGPDIYEYHNSWVPMLRGELSVVPQDVLSSSDYKNIFYPVIADNLRTDEGYVGIPFELDMMTLYINSDILASAGLEAPRTWNKFFDLSKQLTQKPGGEIILAGAAMGITANVDNWPEIVGLLMRQNNVGVNNLQSDKMANVIDFYTGFTARDETWDSSLADSTIAFANGKLAMLLAPLYRNDEIKELNPRLNYYTLKVPQVPSDNPETPDTSYATYWVQGVWAKSVNKNKSWEVLSYMSQVRTLERMNNIRSSLGMTEKLYPRREMGILQRNDPFFLPAVEMAPYLHHWYLYDETNDGENGINTRISNQFESLIKDAKGGRSKSYLKKFSDQLLPILSSYGIGK